MASNGTQTFTVTLTGTTAEEAANILRRGVEMLTANYSGVGITVTQKKVVKSKEIVTIAEG